MTQLVSVPATPKRWPHARQEVLLDPDSGMRFHVIEVTNPWRDGPFSMVFPLPWPMNEGLPHMVAGGNMPMSEMIRELTARIEGGTLLTETEGHARYLALMDQDTEAFGRYTTRTKPNDTTE